MTCHGLKVPHSGHGAAHSSWSASWRIDAAPHESHRTSGNNLPPHALHRGKSSTRALTEGAPGERLAPARKRGRRVPSPCGGILRPSRVACATSLYTRLWTFARRYQIWGQRLDFSMPGGESPFWAPVGAQKIRGETGVLHGGRGGPRPQRSCGRSQDAESPEDPLPARCRRDCHEQTNPGTVLTGHSSGRRWRCRRRRRRSSRLFEGERHVELRAGDRGQGDPEVDLRVPPREPARNVSEMGPVDASERMVRGGLRRVAVRQATDALLVPQRVMEGVVAVLVDDLDLDTTTGLEDSVNLVPNGIEPIDMLEDIQGEDFLHLVVDPRPRRRLEVVGHEFEVVPVVLEMFVGPGLGEIDIEVAFAEIRSTPDVEFHLDHRTDAFGLGEVVQCPTGGPHRA